MGSQIDARAQIKMSVKSNVELEQNKKDNVIVKIVKSITIEPAVFLVSLSTTIENIANSQIAIDKTCKVEFQYNQTVCDNLVTDYKDENELIQENVAQFSVYKTLISSIFPIFFAFYLGAWADLFGRKLLLLLFFIAYFLQTIIELVCAYYEDSKKEFLLIAGVPFTLVGECYNRFPVCQFLFCLNKLVLTRFTLKTSINFSFTSVLTCCTAPWQTI